MIVEAERKLTPVIETLPDFSRRELEILRGKSLGFVNSQIAEYYGIAHPTVNNYLFNISKKMGETPVHGSLKAMADTLRQGLISSDDIPIRENEVITSRQKEILSLIAKGFGMKQIAQELFISYATVNAHQNNLFERLQARNRYHAVAIGIVSGLIK